MCCNFDFWTLKRKSQKIKRSNRFVICYVVHYLCIPAKALQFIYEVLRIQNVHKLKLEFMFSYGISFCPTTNYRWVVYLILFCGWSNEYIREKQKKCFMMMKEVISS